MLRLVTHVQTRRQWATHPETGVRPPTDRRLSLRAGRSRRHVIDAVPFGRCVKCSVNWSLKSLKYIGLIFHDLRRSAARNARASGVAEGVIMKMGGWKTRSVFDRYAIVAESDMADAIERVEALRAQFGHRQPEIAPEKGHKQDSLDQRKLQ